MIAHVDQRADLTRVITEGLAAIIALHREQIECDPDNADWYREDIQRVLEEWRRRTQAPP